MPEIKRVIIIGAGPAGLATALRLQQKNHIQCTLYELRPAPITIGGAVGIPSNGLRLLDRLGVYDALTERGSLDSTFVQHSIQGTVIGEADWTSAGKEKTGFGYMRIKRTALVEVLRNAVEKHNIPIHYGKRLVGVRETADEITVTFSDGTEDTADLLVGSDGIHSSVRQIYVQPGLEPEYTGFSSFFSITPTSSLPADLVPKPALHATYTPEGLFALVPCMPSNQELFWFFSRETPVPESEDSRDGWEVRRKEEVANCQNILLGILADVKGQWGDTLRTLVQSTDAVQFYPVFRLPSGGIWARGRCILIGDAAHAMPPHLGQGVSMALEDGFALSRLVENAEETLEDKWMRYDRVRRPRIEGIIKKAVVQRNMRKRVGPWALWMRETMLMCFLWIYQWMRLDRWGFGQDVLLYDIEQVDL